MKLVHLCVAALLFSTHPRAFGDNTTVAPAAAVPAAPLSAPAAPAPATTSGTASFVIRTKQGQSYLSTNISGREADRLRFVTDTGITTVRYDELDADSLKRLGVAPAALQAPKPSPPLSSSLPSKPQAPVLAQAQAPAQEDEFPLFPSLSPLSVLSTTNSVATVLIVLGFIIWLAWNNPYRVISAIACVSVVYFFVTSNVNSSRSSLNYIFILLAAALIIHCSDSIRSDSQSKLPRKPFPLIFGSLTALLSLLGPIFYSPFAIKANPQSITLLRDVMQPLHKIHFMSLLDDPTPWASSANYLFWVQCALLLPYLFLILKWNQGSEGARTILAACAILLTPQQMIIAFLQRQPTQASQAMILISFAIALLQIVTLVLLYTPACNRWFAEARDEA